MQWSKQWPLINGYYWRRINQRDPPSLVRIIGDTCRFTDGSSEGRYECYAFLGPITPAQAEQFEALCKAGPTVEQCLEELREMFPRYKYFSMSVSIGAPRRPYEIRVGSAFYSAGVRSFSGETLSEAMAQVRKWYSEQSKES